MKRILTILTCIFITAAAAPDMYLDAKPRGKKKKTEVVAENDSKSKSKTSKYDKSFIKDKSCVTARYEDGFMTLHKVKSKIYIELPLTSLDREMIIASTITKSSAADLASIGYKPTTPLHVKFQKMDSTIFMTAVTVLPDYDVSNEPMARAIGLTGMDPVLESWSIHSYNPDSSAVVFDVSSIFMGNYEKLAPVKTGSAGGGVNITATYNSRGTALGDIKAFKDNVTIKSLLSYTVSADLMKLVSLKNKEPFSVEVTRTILLLPEKKMRPRIADSRVGIFLTGRTDMDADKDAIDRYSVIRRWDLQPKDSVAWANGELVEPVKPIVFYLDDAFPELWREPAKKGTLRWNKAFEAIGFKNAVQVVDFPKDDPEFDPDNLKYSCIRYVPSMIANAMGPSWFDPITGEIINASVIVYNDIIKLLNNWRFTQTAQVDPRVRSKRLPDDVVEESIEYVIAHEVGHCLGFMHNMAASAAYPVDSLRNAEFTQKYGTTPSIMDYARFNYIAQPEDKNVCLTPPDLGVYDYYLVKYAYCPILEAEDMKAEQPILEQWVDEKAGDPKYRYGRQQMIHRYDPSAIEEDLGDDPIKAADYGVKNLKYILSHFNEWMPNEVDPDASLRTERYENLAKQYNRYLKAVMLNIGGIYLTEVKPGTIGETTTPVPRERQRESLKWILNELRNCEWIEDRAITDNFPMRVGLEPILQYYTILELFETHKNVILSSYLAGGGADAYTLKNWLDDMYDSIWENTIRRRTLTSADMMMQNLYVTFLTGEVTKKSKLVKVNYIAMNEDSAYLPSVDHIIAFGMDEKGLLYKHIDFLRNVEENEGLGYVASQLALDSFGRPGYNWQPRVNTRTIDNSKTLLHSEVRRVEKLLKSAVASSSGDIKAHYEAALYQLQTAMQTENK